MPKFVIDAHDLRSGSGNEAVEDLVTFLKEQLKTDVGTSGDNLEVETERHSRPHIRLLLRKFLHKTELKEDYHIITGKEQTLVIKATKIVEEED